MLSGSDSSFDSELGIFFWILRSWSLTKPVSIFNFKSTCRVSISLNRTKELHLDVLIDVLFARKVATKLISTSIKDPWKIWHSFPFDPQTKTFRKSGRVVSDQASHKHFGLASYTRRKFPIYVFTVSSNKRYFHNDDKNSLLYNGGILNSNY